MSSYIELESIMNKKHKSRASVITGRIFACLGLFILSFLILFFGSTTIICKGPSPKARDLFVNTVMETSAAKFLARIYFSDEEIQNIIKKNSAEQSDEITDENLIVIPAEIKADNVAKPLEIIDISGSTYNGKMMIVLDPSRIKVATPPALGEEAEGIRISELVKNENAVAGINAGGFKDENGVGSGGQPLGIVIKNGKLVSDGGTSCVIGFDVNNKLIVGNMTSAQAVEKNLRDAVSFGPVFIVNGKRTEVAGWGGGLNPRTCIGQRQDGAVLLLTIDGRQATSLGATYEDCINIMEEYGAINAANLDGGSSTVMYYNDKVINVSASVYGPRQLPTAFVVMPE